MKKEYPYIVKPVSLEEYGVNYVVEFIDFPGITGGGNTQEEAFQVADEALEMYFEVLKSEGRTIPSVTNFKTSGRITLRIPKTMHLKVIEMSEKEGVSINTFIIDALSQKLYSNKTNDDILKNLQNIVDQKFAILTKYENYINNPKFQFYSLFDSFSSIKYDYSNDNLKFTRKKEAEQLYGFRH